MDYEGQSWQGSEYPLSLNLSGLTVASPTNLSPINRPASPSSAHPGRPFGLRISTSTTSISSSNSASAPPSRKRSFTSNPPSLPTLTTTASEDAEFIPEDTPMDLRGSITPGGGASPVDGGSGGSGEEGHPSRQVQSNSAMAAGMGLLGKPMPTNNFVTKLYQMINDPKSAHFINWTELGTSFVVSNVGEFSRSILGSHFKHNNFSSFVRQLNMYGFHKINRTPRAQRTSTDAQTWEFSHHKFLRGRPDLLDEIKRKALEPDPAVKQRVELPGEVAAQLGAMREENRRVWDQLTTERRKVEKLARVLSSLWDVVGKAWPGSVPPFPSDLLESVSDSSSNSPNIYITSPTSATPASRYPPPTLLSVGGGGGGGGGYPNLATAMGVGSPQSSPTAPEFGAHIHHQLHAGHGVHQHHQQQQSHQQMSRQHSHSHSYGVGFNGGSGSRSGSPNGHGQGSGQAGDMGLDMFDDMSPVVQSGSGLAGGSSSATSSSTSVNLTGMGSAGSGSGPTSSSAGVTAEQGDGPGDGPGAPITGRGPKRQRMSISSSGPGPSGSNEDVMMNGHGGYASMMTTAASASSDSLLSPAGHHSPHPHNHNHAHTHAHHAHHSMNMNLGGMGGMGGLTVPSASDAGAGSSNTNPNKRLSTTRARSDSAPLYHHPQHMHGSGSPSHPGNNTGSPGNPGGWGGRPRSGSGMMPMHGPGQGQRDAYGNMQRGVTVPSISMPRAGLGVGGGGVGVGMGGPGLGMPTVPSNAQGQQGR